MKRIKYFSIFFSMCVLLTGCGGKSDLVKQKDDSKANVTPYSMIHSKKPTLWFNVSKLDKNAVINEAYIFEKGKVTTFNGLSSDYDGDTNITLGDISKIDSKELPSEIEKIYMNNKQNKYNREVSSKEFRIKDLEEYIEAYRGDTQELQGELKEIEMRIPLIQENIQELNEKKENKAKEINVTEIVAITDSTGNNTTSEEIVLPRVDIVDVQTLSDEERKENLIVHQIDRRFKINDTIQGIQIYDKYFSGFRLEKEEYLIQLDKHDNIKYGYDSPNIEGITVK